MLSDEELDANAKLFAAQVFRVLDPDRTEVRFNGEWLGEAHLRRGRAADPDAHRRPAARARRLRQALRGRRADLALRAPVPADAGLRLGRDRGRRRDRRHRPALQPPHRPRRDGALRPRAAGRRHVPAARRARRRREDVEVDGQLHRDQRAARGDVRQDDVDPRRGAARSGGTSSPAAASIPTSPMEWKLELARRITARWHGEEAARAGEEHFTRVVRQGEAPEEVPEATFAAGTATRSICRRSSSPSSASPSSHWRRQIDQGGVKLNGDAGRPGYELAPDGLDGRARPGRQAPVRSRSSRLTSGLALLLCPGCPRGRRRKVPASDHNGEP